MPGSRGTRQVRRIQIAAEYARALSELADDATTDEERDEYLSDVCEALWEVRSVLTRCGDTKV